VVGGRLVPSFGHLSGRAPRDPAFRRERDAELGRIQTFLGLEATR
jgi:hypothetical protein